MDSNSWREHYIDNREHRMGLTTTKEEQISWRISPLVRGEDFEALRV